jgi:hypothetical protein
MEYMGSATFTPAPAGLSSGAAAADDRTSHPRHLIGNALHAIKVYL